MKYKYKQLVKKCTSTLLVASLLSSTFTPSFTSVAQAAVANEQKTFDLTKGTFTNTELKNGKLQLKENSTGKYAPNGTWESEILDLGNNVGSITKLNSILDVSGLNTNAKLYTSTSQDGDTFEYYKLINSDGTLTSTTGRYIKVKAELSSAGTEQTTPLIDFTSEDAAKFETNDNVVFDGSLKLKNNYQYDMTRDANFSGPGNLFRYSIDKKQFKTIEKISASTNAGYTDKYLFQDGSDIKKYQEGGITSTTTAIPKMTANTFPEGRAFSSSVYSSAYDAWYAFNQTDETEGFATANGQVAGHLGYEFSSNKTIGKYAIRSGNTQFEKYPKNWTFEASNDGSSWTVLDTQVNQSWTTNYTDKVYTITAPSSFKMYRLNWTANNGYPTYTDINELKLYEISSPSGWQTIGSAPATKAMFESYGMNDLSILDNNAIQQLSSNASELLTWTNEEETQNSSVPRMTSNTAPSPYSTIQSFAHITYAPWKAFDGDKTTIPSYWDSVYALPGYLGMDYGVGNAVIIDSYAITSGNYNLIAPKTWTFEASNDLTNWVILDSQTGVPVFTKYQTRKYTTENTTAYRYYRVNITANHDTNQRAYIQELEFFSPDSKVYPSRQINLTGVPHDSIVVSNEDVNLGNIDRIQLNAVQKSGYGPNLIPSMTSNTAPSGTANGTWNGASGNDKWKAFDGVPGTFWASANSLPAWISYEFPVSKVVSKYTIRAYGDAGQPNPKTWTFDGWNGSAWVTLDTQTNVDWGNSKTHVNKDFIVNNTTAYKKYRLNATASTYGSMVFLYEFTMHEAAAGNTDIKLLVSGDSGANWKGKSIVNINDLASTKTNGFTPAEFNALTKAELDALFPSGKARFAYYLEQEKATDIVEVNSLNKISLLSNTTPYMSGLSIDFNQALAQPTGLSATPGESKIDLHWNANTESGITGYNIYKDGTKLNDSTITNTNYSVTGLTNNQTYTFAVEALDNQGHISPKATISGTPVDQTAPNAPLNLSGTNSDKSVLLNWAENKESDLAGYNVYRNGMKINTALVTNAEYQVTGLTAGQSYNFEVSAVDNSNNESQKSNKVTLVAKSIPDMPSHFVGHPTSTSVDLSWDLSTFANEYILKRDGLEIYRGDGQSFTDTNLSEHTTYEYSLTAKNELGASQQAVASVKTLSTSAFLSTVTMSQGMLNPIFNKNIDSYEVSVNHNITNITVTPTAEVPQSIVKVNGTNVASGIGTTIPLLVGKNVITVTVVSEDGSNTKNYTFMVNRAASSNANLNSLAPSAGTLNPTFNGSQTTYMMSVPTGNSMIKFTPVVEDSNSFVYVNDNLTASGQMSTEINLKFGLNNIPIKVIAQDGTVKIYTVFINREGNTNADLNSLTISTGSLSPAFASNTTSYMVNVGSSVSSMTFTGVPVDSNAKIKINDTEVLNGVASNPIPIQNGLNTITIMVTAEDGSTTKKNTVTVNKTSNSNTNLASLTTSSGTLMPVFDSLTTSYTVEMPNYISNFRVTPTAEDSNAKIYVNESIVTSGTGSQIIPLSVGDNEVKVRVLAEDGVNSKTYKIIVKRAPSTDASLLNLHLSNGALNPSFVQNTMSYLANVDYSVSTISLIPTLSHESAKISVNGQSVLNNAPSQPIPLEVGNNPVVIIVTAEDGVTQKTYNVTITRQPSADATLSNLILSDGTLPSGFYKDTLSYTANVPKDIASIKVKAVSSNPFATIEVNRHVVISGADSQPVPLIEGRNNVAVMVTAQDGETVKIYNVTVDIDRTPPKVPMNLQGTSEDRKATLIWDNVNDLNLAGYNIYQDGVKINSIPISENNYVVENLTNEKTYIYEVTSIDKSGNESNKSASIVVKPTQTYFYVDVTERTNLYALPNELFKMFSSISPQKVKVIATDNSGKYYKIPSYMGEVWIPISSTKIQKYPLVLTKRTNIYEEMDNTKGAIASLSPQTVYYIQKQGNYYKVQTWLGYKWIHVERNILVQLNESTPMYEIADGKYQTGASLSPQTVIAVDEENGFYKVQTWLGYKYIKPSDAIAGELIDEKKYIQLTKVTEMYTLPNTNSKYKGKLSPQVVISSQSWNNEWFKIKTSIGDLWIKQN